MTPECSTHKIDESRSDGITVPMCSVAKQLSVSIFPSLPFRPLIYFVMLCVFNIAEIGDNWQNSRMITISFVCCLLDSWLQ